MVKNNSRGILMKKLVPGNAILLPYLLVLAVILLRLTVSHPYNFVPVFSCLLFFGAWRPTREFAMPLLSLIGVDIFLTTHQYGFAVTSGDAITWMSYLGAMFLGAAMLGRSVSTGRAVGATLLASVSFFVASNFMVWAAWGMYPKTWGGLGACYVAALPFVRNSLGAETVSSLLIVAVVHMSGTLAMGRRVQGTCA
jgi:hypothetical protein